MRVGITSFIIVLFYLAVNMKPVTKLNLGINPMACDVGSLMFAKNMKVDKDDCLVNDYGYEDIEALKDYNIIGHIVGLDDKIYLFTDEPTLIKTGTEDIYTKFENEAGNLYKHVLETTTHYIDYINNNVVDRHYYCIPAFGGYENDDNAYKLSEIGLTTTYYDTGFGFYVDYDPTVENPIDDYINKLLTKIEDVIEHIIDDNIKYKTRDVSLSTTLVKSIFSHFFFSDISLEGIEVKGIIENTTDGDIEIEEYSCFEYDNTLIDSPRTEETDLLIGTYTTIPKYKLATIVEYDEITKNIKAIECSWKYSGGTIEGCVTTNVTGEKILTVAEHIPTEYIDYESSNTTSSVSSPRRANRSGEGESLLPVDGKEDIGRETVIEQETSDEDDDYVRPYSGEDGGTIIIDDGEGHTETITIDPKSSSVESNNDKSSTRGKVNVSSLIPIKHINLNYCSYNDDESIYTQAPKVPIANLNLVGTYARTIPNGVYVFFIRYEIRKDVYTNWYLCSRPIFAGVSESINTLQGGLKYINLHKDSAKSFVLSLSFVEEENKKLYNKFQLGFIISHDEAVDARMWKTFDINTTGIYFDYDGVEDANIDDLQKTAYEIYNVDNVVSFKNKLYISNYVETDFNPVNGQELASKISLSVVNNGNVTPEHVAKLAGYTLHWNNVKSYYDKLANGGNINSILTQNMFDITCNNSSTGNAQTKTKAVSFDGRWNRISGADLLTIYNIQNDIKGTPPFGDTWGTTDFNDGRLGVILKEKGLTYYGYKLDTANPHPWYNKGLTFIYGSMKDHANRTPYLISGVNKFNKESYDILNQHDDPTNFPKPWVARDAAFTNESLTYITDNIKTEAENYKYVSYAYMYITSSARTYKIDFTEHSDDVDYVLERTKEGYDDISIATKLNNLVSRTYDAIKNNIVGIMADGTPVLKIDGTEIQANHIDIVYKRYTFDVQDPNDINDVPDKAYHKRWVVDLKTEDITYSCNFLFKDGVLTIVSGEPVISTQSGSLMPHSTYKAYAHFVDEHNIITNGFLIGTVNTGGINSSTDILSLQYTIDGITNSKFKAFFISLENVGDKIVECFAYSKDENNNNNYVHSIEIDSLLYNLNSDITIIDNTGNIVTKNAKYYSSGESNPGLAFGNCGYITWQDNVDYSSVPLFISIKYDNSTSENNKLIKCSNYLPLVNNNGEDVIDGFYGSYLCTVKKPSFSLSSMCYVSGKDIYSTTRAQNYVTLKEFTSFVNIQNSITYMIRSSFNLNYLSLTEDINDQIFNITGTGSNSGKQVAKVINSAILSYIYELKPMYKDFSNLYFREKTDYAKIDFDNTIRVSNVLADESFNNSVFSFNPTDYYNIPTDRGIIIKLISIGNQILAHTKGSLYKFDANGTIVTNEKDIQIKESDPFDTGISQVFDSQYGYGGINNKEAGCVTFDSYFFYDCVSKHIFGYSGNGQITPIDNTIFNFVEYYSPKICRTIHDEHNDRILFEFVSDRPEDKDKEYNSFCISYNYKTKSFISLHDLTLFNGFNSRYKCYSYNKNFVSLFTKVDTIDTEIIETDRGTWKIYGDATVASIVSFGTEIYDKNLSPFNIALVVQTAEGKRDVLNNIKYVANVIQESIKKSENPLDLFVINQQSRTNPVTRFYAITDICISSEIKTNVNDAARPNSLLDYQGFKYNLGSWSSNYFRNKLNKNNIYSYPNQPGVGREINTDNNSLVYGRYFVLFFEFLSNTPIKFEDILINSNDY